MPKLLDNRQARYQYEFLEEYEAGLALEGQEVKSLRAGGASLKGSFVNLKDGQAWVVNMYIPLYAKAGKRGDYDPDRTRRLLLHKRELLRISGKLAQKGLTLVPICVYTKGSKLKLTFALARGKKKYEKREAIKKKDIERDIRRSLKR